MKLQQIVVEHRKHATLHACALALAGVLGMAATADAASMSDRPTVNLFSRDVIDTIKQTGTAAKAIEDGIASVVHRLEQTEQLYKTSDCEKGNTDVGCEKLRQQLGESYLEMLDKLEAYLPAIAESMKNTQKTLAVKIRDQYGKNMTAHDLQEAVKTARTEQGATSSARFPLSQRVERIAKLVQHGSGGSLPVLAAQMYLDSAAVSGLLNVIYEEINRGRLMAELNQAWGMVTPEMQSTVDGVKGILFGEAPTSSGLAAPVDPIATDGSAAFRSRFEM